jgi:hypothetical protein
LAGWTYRSASLSVILLHWPMVKHWTWSTEKNVFCIWSIWNIHHCLSPPVCTFSMRYGLKWWTVHKFCFYLSVVDLTSRAKYPLVLIDKLLGVYRPNGGCAYNIGCVFSKTLGNSLLAPQVVNLGFRMMVGAFHGHAHNWKCQLHWHPLYIPGTGHSEGEGCEHIFSASNELARSTRHASPFHQHQSIEEHFTFWDKDKYAAISS